MPQTDDGNEETIKTSKQRYFIDKARHPDQ
jgi:hypothetical protein